MSILIYWRCIVNSIDSVQMNPYMNQNNLFQNDVSNNDIANLNKNTPQKIEDSTQNNAESNINNQAVNVSISMQSMLVYVHVRSLEFVQNNTEAQDMLQKIFNNEEVFNFLDGGKASNGLDLKDIGYEGKEITKLTPEEAKELVSEEGFFGVEKTSQRVADFAIGISQGDIEALKEARSGVVRGFEEAEKLWGGELPEISYETQERTLELIDEKIDEMLGKDKKEDKDDGLGESPAESLEKEDSKEDETEEKES